MLHLIPIDENFRRRSSAKASILGGPIALEQLCMYLDQPDYHYVSFLMPALFPLRSQRSVKEAQRGASPCLMSLLGVWLNLVSCVAIVVQYWVGVKQHGFVVTDRKGCGGFWLSIMLSLLYPASPHIPLSENVVVNARGRSPRDTHTA